MPEDVFRITEAFPDGFTVVVLATGLIPIKSATSLLVFLTICAPSLSISALNNSGHVIHPVIDTPNKDSPDTMSSVCFPK